MPYKDPESRKAYLRIYSKKRYATDAEYRERQKLQCKTNPNRPAIETRSKQKAKRLDPLRFKAKDAVHNEVKRKRWPAASELFCATCGNKADHYHHYFGYEQQHWYDVIPLCKACHRATHQQLRCSAMPLSKTKFH
jgi:hypothetical protein